MKHCKILALAAAAAVALPAVAQAAPGTVTFRAEGKAATLVPETQVTTTTAPVGKDGECRGTSALGALELATGGDWDGSYNSGFGDYFVTRIKTEQPSGNDFFSLFVNGVESQRGFCGTELQQGDDVLVFVGTCDFSFAEQRCTNPPVHPLDLEAPAAARPGVPFVVRVVALPGDGSRKPVEGATISGEGISATASDADGYATVRRDASGPVALQATKPGSVRSARRTPCVSNGQDGACGSSVPSSGTPAATPAPPRVVRAKLTGGPREGAIYRPGAAPRTLRGSVPVFNSRIDRVRLRVTRNDRGRCSTLDAEAERLVRTARCGAKRGEWFVLGDRAEFEYQLPLTLPRGRYVVDLQVRDAAGRVSRLERGNTRVVFRVR